MNCFGPLARVLPYVEQQTLYMTINFNETFAKGSSYGSDWTLLPFSSQHPGGCLMLHADGSAAFASDTIDINIWRAKASMAGGETF